MGAISRILTKISVAITHQKVPLKLSHVHSLTCLVLTNLLHQVALPVVKYMTNLATILVDMTKLFSLELMNKTTDVSETTIVVVFSLSRLVSLVLPSRGRNIC